MNSIFCVFGLYSVILAVNVLSFKSDVHGVTYAPTYPAELVILTPPLHFGYNWGDYLNVKVIFNNLSPGVVYTVYEADEAGTMILSKKVLKSHAGSDVHSIKKKVMHQKILFYVEIISARWCKNLIIFEGRALPRTPDQAADPEYEYNDVCLRSDPSCTIEVDLQNECIVTDISTAEPFERTDQTLPHEKNQATSPANEGNDQQQSSLIKVLINVIPSVIGIGVIILVIYISVKKYCHQNSHPVEVMELDTYATANQVVYADLSLMYGDSQPPRRDEESSYAKIIGVMKPVDKDVRKKKT